MLLQKLMQKRSRKERMTKIWKMDRSETCNIWHVSPNATVRTMTLTINELIFTLSQSFKAKINLKLLFMHLSIVSDFTIPNAFMINFLVSKYSPFANA